MLNNQSKVLLPKWLITKKSKVKEEIFLDLVREYLLRYPGYTLIRVDGSRALCDRSEGG
ncbi:hypothetical protein [Cytobacillus praedii]|uniref:hypothetical protein n=1 Tax=Cytobacillus praedii TaxID=1742358 RepID=UPI0013F4A975|nr:hypothetical protein [Cytobacillus praedii]